MAAKLTRLTHKIAMQLHLMAESYTICSSCFRRPVLKLLDPTSYNMELTVFHFHQILVWSNQGGWNRGVGRYTESREKVKKCAQHLFR